MIIDEDLDGWWLEIGVDSYNKGKPGNKWSDTPYPEEPEEIEYLVKITDGKKEIYLIYEQAKALGYSRDTVLELYRDLSYEDEASRLADQAENRRDMEER